MKKILIALLLTTAGAFATQAPKVSIATMQDLPVTTMHVYDEDADANARVAAVFEQAKKSHKRVIIDLGGNWCGDCIILANFLELPEMHRFMKANYETTSVDVGRFNKNLQVPARFGFTDRLKGVPTLIIATPEGKLVNGTDVFATSDARNMKPQAIADYFAKYAK
ncbi:MAG: thiol-disulfide isomerase [Alphaproteobacteria bacterium]|nr:thiol-disulfide isomerase [Alphaproteobacteria bacterium]